MGGVGEGVVDAALVIGDIDTTTRVSLLQAECIQISSMISHFSRNARGIQCFSSTESWSVVKHASPQCQPPT